MADLAGSLGADFMQDLTVGAYRFIARTPSLLTAVRLADLTDEKKPTNIPGTSDTYPNWKLKLSVLLKSVMAAMWEEWPRE